MTDLRNDLSEHDELERRLRATLRTRAEDVEPTPALYRRVQDDLDRARRRPLWLGALGAAAALVAAAVIVPTLLDDGPDLDIAPQPPSESASPSGAPSPSDGEAVPGDGAGEGAVDAALAAALTEAGLVFADASSTVTVGDRTVPVDQDRGGVATLTAWVGDQGADDVVVAVGFADGSIGLIDLSDGTEARVSYLDAGIDALANGAGLAFSPDGQAVAWIDGADLHVLPLRSGSEAERVFPLDADLPAGLAVQDWFEGVDVPLILASSPDGVLWSIPMDVGSVFQTAPTDRPIGLDTRGFATDGLWLPNLALASVRGAVPGDTLGATLTIDEDRPEPLPGMDGTVRPIVSTDDRGAFTVLDPDTGTGLLLTSSEIEPDAGPVRAFADRALAAVAPLDVPDDIRTAEGPLRDLVTGEPVGGEPGPSEEPQTPDVRIDTTSTAAGLGLDTGHLVVGTDGTDLVTVDVATGEQRRLQVYPQPESEAVLGELAVLPGSTIDDGLVVVESSSEGETSLRLVVLTDGSAEPALASEPLVTAGDVTGLVVDEDGRSIAWTDGAGLHAADVAPDAGLTVVTDLGPETRPVVDWAWTGQLEDGQVGTLTVGIELDGGRVGHELVEVERDADGTLILGGPSGGSDRLTLDSHANPGVAVGPEFGFVVAGDAVTITWSADGDQSGELATIHAFDPSPTRFAAKDGVVVVSGDELQVAVTAAGDPQVLPPATDWAVLG